MDDKEIAARFAVLEELTLRALELILRTRGPDAHNEKLETIRNALTSAVMDRAGTSTLAFGYGTGLVDTLIARVLMVNTLSAQVAEDMISAGKRKDVIDKLKSPPPEGAA